MKTATLILEFQASRYESTERDGEREVLIDQHKIEISATGPYLDVHGHLDTLALLRERFANYTKIIWHGVMIIGKDDIPGLAYYTAVRPCRSAHLLRGPLAPQTIAESFLRSPPAHKCRSDGLLIYATRCRRSDRDAEDAALSEEEAWALYEAMAGCALTDEQRQATSAPWVEKVAKATRPRRWATY